MAALGFFSVIVVVFCVLSARALRFLVLDEEAEGSFEVGSEALRFVDFETLGDLLASTGKLSLDSVISDSEKSPALVKSMRKYK